MQNRQTGNVLVATVAIVGFFLMLIVFVAINYSQLFATHKEAQTASDAAALQAAIDISKITYMGTFGPVALVDQAPVSTSFDKPPVRSINKLLATIRLDMLIAGELANPRMLSLAEQDLRAVLADAQGLRRKIIASVPEVRKNAQAIYDHNSRRIGKGRRVGRIQVELGSVRSGVFVTTVPVPAPIHLAQVTDKNSGQSGSIRCYLANVPVPTQVMGRNYSFEFAGVGREPALIANDHLVTLSQTTLPCAVRVTATEQVNAVARDATPHPRLVTTVACAIAGGTAPNLVTEPSGTFAVSFPQGLPRSSATLDFTSVKSIMNSTGWNPLGDGSWFQAQGGPVPGNPAAILARSPYRGMAKDNPGDALASLVYDWLRAAGLRPNIAEVGEKLSANLSTAGAGTAIGRRKRNQAALLLPPALAGEETETMPVASAIFDMSSDPRSQENFNQNPAAYRAQLSNIFGYKPAGATIPETGLSLGLLDGVPLTTDGNPSKTLYDFWQELLDFNHLCKANVDLATKVANDTLQSIQEPLRQLSEKTVQKTWLQDQIDEMKKRSPVPTEAIDLATSHIETLTNEIEVLKSTIGPAAERLDRCRRVIFNASYGLHTSMAIRDNLKGITAGGVSQLSPHHYKVNGISFTPATTLVTKADLENTAAIPTGQAPIALVRDWAAPALNGQSRLEFFKQIATPVATREAHPCALMQPALAKSSIPVNQNLIFSFNILGNAANPGKSGNGEVRILRFATSPFAGQSVLEGQYLYQNVHAFLSASNSPGLANTVWQVVGRDECANPSGTYFASENAPGVSVSPKSWCHKMDGKESEDRCPPLACEFSIRCPMGAGVCIPQTFYVGGSLQGYAGMERREFSYHDAWKLLLAAVQVLSNPQDPSLRQDFAALRAIPGVDASTAGMAVLKKHAEITVKSLTSNGPFSMDYFGTTFNGWGSDIRNISPCARISIEHG